MNIMQKIKAKIRSEPEKEQTVKMMSFSEFKEACATGYTPLNKHPDVKVCVKRIAELISSMTIYQMQNKEIGNIRLSDGLSRKVDIDPSPYLTRKTLIYKCVEELLFTGNSFLLPVYSREGFLSELKPIDRGQAQFMPITEGGYSVKIGNVAFSSDEIINFVNNPSLSEPWKGQSYKVYLNDVLRNLKQSNQIKSDFYTKHYRPGLIFFFQGDSDIFDDEDKREETFNKWLKTKPGTPYMLPEGLIDIKTFQNMSLKDMAINESVAIDKKFIAALIGVPAFFLGVGKYDEKEYNNFIDTTIRPITEILQQELTKKLLIANDRFFRFNINGLKAFDMDNRLDSLYRGKALGVFNGDEVRVAAGYEPTGIKEMQEYTLLENYIKVQDTGKQKKLTQEGGEKIGNEDS